MDKFERIFRSTLDFLHKGIDQENTEILPKAAIMAAAVVASVVIFNWLPDHDPANERRAA